LADSFVRDRYYTFSQERENQAGIHVGYGPASNHPGSLAGNSETGVKEEDLSAQH